MGKSWIIELFGKKYFKSIAIVNFEQKPELKHCFNSLDPKIIINRIEFYLKQDISIGNTLLFLDEIQLCPKALTALRYFKEQMPELHVVAAGSLLEFALEDERFSFPVGRVEFLYMYPLSFVEFLEATEGEKNCKLLSSITLHNPIDDTSHQYLLSLVKNFFLIGGMPESVSTYDKTNSFEESRMISSRQLEAFSEDFGKYAKKSQHLHLKKLFDRIPQLVGSHFKFSKIDPEAPNPARDYKTALLQLKRAGLLHLIYDTRANGLPLQAEINEKKFKTLFLDIGLLQCALKVTSTQSLLRSHHDSLAEQFVGQELLAYSSPHEKAELFFWESYKPSTSSEIDYVISIESNVVPIEVKAGCTGRLRSLKQFLEKKQVPLGIKISETPLALKNNILEIPMYLISELPNLYTEALMLYQTNSKIGF